MSKFRNKLVVEATRWFKPGDHADVHVWTKGGHVFVNGQSYVETSAGRDMVLPGDWVVTGSKGDLTVLEHSQFIATYEPIAEDDNPG